MKKLKRFSIFCALLAATVFTGALHAQDAKKELLEYTKKFQDTYNKKDDQGLKMMYTDNAVRTDASGNSITGNENIRAEFAQSWTENDIMIVIKQDKAELQADGSVLATGTYHVSGKAKSGEKIERDGTYTNTVVKDAGNWKISKSVLGNVQ